MKKTKTIPRYVKILLYIYIYICGSQKYVLFKKYIMTIHPQKMVLINFKLGTFKI